MIGRTISKYKILEKLLQKDGGQVGQGGNPAISGLALSRRKLNKRTY